MFPSSSTTVPRLAAAAYLAAAAVGNGIVVVDDDFGAGTGSVIAANASFAADAEVVSPSSAALAVTAAGVLCPGDHFLSASSS